MEYHPTVYTSKLQIYGRRRDATLYRRKRFDIFQSLYYQDLCAHYGCVNALEFSNDAGMYLASGGDDKRVLLWNVGLAIQRPNYRPFQMKATHLSNIFCIAFSKDDDNLVSSGNDGQIIVHDIGTCRLVDVFVCEASVYGLSANPVNKYQIAAACEDGAIHIMDTRLSKADGLCLARRSTAFHSVMFSPVDHHLIASAHARDGMALWDIRSPKKEVLHYGNKGAKQRAMSARFNKTGNQLLCLRRRQPMALFNINQSTSIAEFDCEGYSNSCTMKSCCFAGDKDQYIVSGSDDFGVYIWKIPEYLDKDTKVIPKASKKLIGHRSIVNQVRFNPDSNILVSCGVEKMVKLWCTESLPFGSGNTVTNVEAPRKRYSHNEYIELILESSSMIHDYHTENTQEDPKMLAFFDSLVQHEADEHASDTSASDDDATIVIESHPFFATGDTPEPDSDSSGPGDNSGQDEGPATLETLGIQNGDSESTALSGDAQKRLRKLRATVHEEVDWRARDISEEYTAETFRKKFVTPKTKRRRRDMDSNQSQKYDSTDSEDEAARTRQRNACRRQRKQSNHSSNTSDDAAPTTSGLQKSVSISDKRVYKKDEPPSS